jgi:hypothetical protein
MAKVITINALAEGTDVQSIMFTKAPGKPIQCVVTIGTDAAAPHDRYTAVFALSAVTGGPTALQLKAVRDFALAALGF